MKKLMCGSSRLGLRKYIHALVAWRAAQKLLNWKKRLWSFLVAHILSLSWILAKAINSFHANTSPSTTFMLIDTTQIQFLYWSFSLEAVQYHKSLWKVPELFPLTSSHSTTLNFSAWFNRFGFTIVARIFCEDRI